MRDFTLDMYRLFCEVLSKKSTFTVRDFIILNPKNGVIIRHDVDVSAEKALRMAKIENQYGLKSTYYFRYPKTFNPKIMIEIQDMGHEVGYHYETLDKANGNNEKAIEIFKSELSKFREYVDIKTISMHGGVLTKYDNRDLWKNNDFKKYGIIGEAYLSVDFEKTDYYTDTGRDWSGKHSIKDKPTKSNKKKTQITNTKDLIKLIENYENLNIYINTHPKRWANTLIEYLSEFSSQYCKNFVKCIIIHYKKKG